MKSVIKIIAACILISLVYGCLNETTTNVEQEEEFLIWEKFKVFNFWSEEFNHIEDLAIDQNDNIWIATYSDGIIKFDGEKYTQYNSDNTPMTSNYVMTLAIDENNELWAGSVWVNGLVKYSDSNWLNLLSNLPLNAGVNDITIDLKGNKWIGTKQGGVTKYDGNNWIVFDTVNSKLPNNYVYSIAVGESGEKWFATYGGLAKFDDTNWVVYNTNNSDIFNDSIEKVAVDNNNNKWIGTSFKGGGGLMCFNDTTWIKYDTSNSELPNNNITAITVDEKGVIWVGTLSGFVKITDSTWTVFDSENSDLQSDYIKSITIDKYGYKWLGAYGGFTVYRGD